MYQHLEDKIEKKYKCPKCNKGFSQDWTLQNHVKQCNEVKNEKRKG